MTSSDTVETPAPFLTTDDLFAAISEIESLRERLSALVEHFDSQTEPLITAWMNAGNKVPCGVRGTGWTFDDASGSGLSFTHNCWDHGYDLSTTEYITIPWSFVETSLPVLFKESL